MRALLFRFSREDEKWVHPATEDCFRSVFALYPRQGIRQYRVVEISRKKDHNYILAAKNAKIAKSFSCHRSTRGTHQPLSNLFLSSLRPLRSLRLKIDYIGHKGRKDRKEIFLLPIHTRHAESALKSLFYLLCVLCVLCGLKFDCLGHKGRKDRKEIFLLPINTRNAVITPKSHFYLLCVLCVLCGLKFDCLGRKDRKGGASRGTQKALSKLTFIFFASFALFAA